jgi:hypothetical protein
MPLIQRKRTIPAAIRNVLIAPFVLVLAMVVSNRWILFFALCLLLFCYWVNSQPIQLPLIQQKDVIIWLGVFAFIMIAATPLAIRDYFSNGGMETVWEPDAACVEEGRHLAKLLLDRDDRGFYEELTEELKAKVSLAEFTQSVDVFETRVGRLTCFAFFGQCDILFWRAPEEPSDVAEEVWKVLEWKR